MTSHHRIQLGLQQMRLGNCRGAIPHFRAALAEDPDNALVHAYAALCLIDMGNPDAAARMSRIAISIAPDDAYIHLAAGLVALARMNYDTAGKHLEESRRLDPTEPDVYRWLAELYDRTGRRQQVVPVLEEGLKHGPEDVRLIASLGLHYMESGRREEAEKLSLRALAINPEYDDANILQGHVLLSKGDRAGAFDQVMLALRRNPTNAAALRLFCAAKAKGNPIAALWWRLAVKLERMGSGAPLYTFLLVFLIGFYALARILIGSGLVVVAAVLLVPAAAVVLSALYGAWRIHQVLKPTSGDVKLRRDF